MDRRRTRSDEVPTPTIDTDDNEDGSGEDMDEEADSYEDQCHMCKGGGEVVCCDYCPKAYHLACVNLKVRPESSCNACLTLEQGHRKCIIRSCVWVQYPPDGHARFACPPCGDDGKHCPAMPRCHYTSSRAWY